jgi:DNA processing protein
MTAPRILRLDDPHYPTALRNLPQPPPTLYVQGRLDLLERPGIAVVGTRRHSTYGRDTTVSLVVGLVRAGYVIVSGLARGIDSIAHRTAIDVGGDTIGVLGTGIDVPYPPEHTDLFTLIAERGCLVSEFPPGTPPRKYHFPQRNRIIAGLARAVLVVEAPEKSGALITAHYALEEGKEVFAVPGPIHNRTGSWRDPWRTAL